MSELIERSLRSGAQYAGKVREARTEQATQVFLTIEPIGIVVHVEEPRWNEDLQSPRPVAVRKLVSWTLLTSSHDLVIDHAIADAINELDHGPRPQGGRPHGSRNKRK